VTTIPLRAVPRDRPRHLAVEAAAALGIVQLHVVDTPARRPQRPGVVAHGRQDVGELAPVVAHVGGLVPHLHHQQHGRGLIRTFQRRQAHRQLIAKDGDESGHAFSCAGPSAA
jgi:hypothetical protein